VTEDPKAVAEAVAAILDSGEAGELEDVARVQSATLRIKEANLELEDEKRLLLALFQTAKDLPLAAWCIKGMLWVIGEDVTPFDVPSEKRERAARRLRFAGYDRCPTCEAEVPRELELEHWARGRRWNAEAVETAARRDRGRT
jgi:hypothetical protein